MRGRQYRKSSIKKDSGGERAPRVNAPRARLQLTLTREKEEQKPDSATGGCQQKHCSHGKDQTNMPAAQTSPWNTHATAMMGDVCAPLASILRCCVCLLRAPRASDHVCTALRGGQRRRPAPEPSDTKCRGFGDGGTALVTLGDAQAPSQSCSAASFYLERRARPITPSLCDAQFCWGRRCIFTGSDNLKLGLKPPVFWAAAPESILEDGSRHRRKRPIKKIRKIKWSTVLCTIT